MFWLKDPAVWIHLIDIQPNLLVSSVSVIVV